MIEYYSSSWVILVFITFLLGLCILAQTLTIILKYYSEDKKKDQIFENLFELAILGVIFILSLLQGEVVNGYKNSIVVPVGYEKIRIFILLSILILAAAIYFINKNKIPLNVIIASTILLPVEKLLGSFYSWFFIFILIFFLIRSIEKSIFYLIIIRKNISALSIVHGVDTLPTGILFYESDGYTILSNYQMQKLMILTTGKVFRNSIEFYKNLTSDKYKSRYEKVQIEGQSVYLLPDQSAWMVKKTKIAIKNKNYIHISATDVSENWALTVKLQCQEEELKKRSEELKNTILNLHILSREKEIEKAKIRAHDILGQRLTVLLRMIQNEDVLDYDLLISLSKSLLKELKEEDKEISFIDELKNIKDIFNAIGVDIHFKGKLPNDEEKAHLFIDIIREASTNAVRHGFAKLINIDSEEKDDSYKLVIENIGYTRPGPIIPGGGIKAMKRKIESQGGSLKITPYPKFTLTATLPGGGKNV